VPKRIVEIKEKPLLGDSYRRILIGKIDAYQERSGIKSDSTLSRMIFGTDPTFISILRKGGNFTLEKGTRLEKWILHSEKMLSGEIPPGPLPPIRKAPKAAKPKPAVAPPAKNVVPLKAGRKKKDKP
jgi:hypothetical protein